METNRNYLTQTAAGLSTTTTTLPCKYNLSPNGDGGCKCALVGTVDKSLANARAVRDSFLTKNPSSGASLLASQFAHALMKIQRGMPATKGDVESLIRAAAWRPPREVLTPLNGGSNRRQGKNGKRHRRPRHERNIRRPFQPQKHTPVLSGSTL